MAKESSTTSSGLSLTSVLTVIFIVLKLVHVIHWSWWLVLLPSLLGVGLWAVIIVLGLLALALLK